MLIMDCAFAPAFGEAWTRPQVEGSLDLPGTWLTVAASDDDIVGFSLMRSVLDEAELLLIAVNPGWQGRNIGRTLLLDNIATAHSRNIHHIHLEVRSEEHTSELQSLMSISYAVFCLKKKTHKTKKNHQNTPS